MKLTIRQLEERAERYAKHAEAVRDVNSRPKEITLGFVNPFIVAFVNLFPLIMGLGYLFLGKWERFVVVFLGLQLGVANLLEAPEFQEVQVAYLVLLWIGTIIDGYVQARLHNTRVRNARNTQ
jgi:hypothetical protein